ncbi:MAG: TonB-dependent receptor, partial [Bacteroidota bacterium]|nr:TonB-dependent receptor [Bacteroidota bacterium]
VILSAKESITILGEMVEDYIGIEQVVVSADRNSKSRRETPTIVNAINSKLFERTQNITVSEGLNFAPGLRMENNCQNCGFTQVRMNGLEGPYSQILINSRPIFSGLAGVYGLELIPSNMIERVEVVRGGGSALFGGNAIAGTINIILKDPVTNSYEIGANTGLTGVGLNNSGGSAADYSVNFNTSIVSDDRKTGVAVYGFSRERKMFDANNDGFSEISPMKNLTIGTRFFHRFGHRSRATVDFFNIKEERDGGNKHDYPLHERDVAEAVEHDIKTVAFTYDQFFRDYDMLSVYASGQFLNRDSYYGANYSLSDYGNSKDKTYNMGVQYKAMFGNSSLIGGIENTGGFLTDKKMGYPDYDNAVIVDGKIVSIPHTENTIVADQSTVTTGMFAQYELKFNKTKLTAGGRFDVYKIEDFAKSSNKKTGKVFSPRFSLMHELTRSLQARASYSQGYRAPQIFDEDLHIETSGSR